MGPPRTWRAGRAAAWPSGHARTSAVDEPELARELGVGRPDVPGAEHMGVVDVNHASPEALSQLPSEDAELAGRLVAAREEVTGFVSAQDARGAGPRPDHGRPDLAPGGVPALLRRPRVVVA